MEKRKKLKNSKRFVLLGILVIATCSCTVSLKEGQISCEYKECPDDWVCNPADLKCYSDENEFSDPSDGGTNTDEGDASTHDAGTDEATDSDTDTDTDTGDTNTPCSGVQVDNLCWYLGVAGESCVQTCSDSNIDDRMASLIGSSAEGGSRKQCDKILEALGRSGTVTVISGKGDLGLGCYVGDKDNHFWLSQTPFNANDAQDKVRRVCACVL